jgi:hypothetical protein
VPSHGRAASIDRLIDWWCYRLPDRQAHAVGPERLRGPTSLHLCGCRCFALCFFSKVQWRSLNLCRCVNPVTKLSKWAFKTLNTVLVSLTSYRALTRVDICLITPCLAPVTGLLCKNVLIYLNLFNFSPLLPKSPVLSRDVSFSSPAEAIGRTGRRNRRFVLVDDWRIGARVEARKVGGVRAALFKG